MPELQTSTIKDQLLQLITVGEQNPDTLRKRLGLNGHDLVKNLEQLRKEGHVAFKWGKGDRIERVWVPKGAANMQLLAGHTGEDATLKGDYQIKLGNAINRLPWNGEWRTYDHDALKRNSGLTSPQIASTMKALREKDRLQQLGGGTRGVPIKGVRWRGERPAEAVEATIQAEPSPHGAKRTPEPSQAVRDTAAYLRSLGRSPGFPIVTAALEQWRKIETAHGLLIETGNEPLAEALANTADFLVLSTLAAELEVLMKVAGRASS